MNKWTEVAKLFDLELEEEFKLVDKHDGELFGAYYFTDKGLKDSKNCSYTCILTAMLNDEYKIIKKPWKPKVDESIK